MSMKTRDEKEKKRDLFTTIFWILVLVFLIVKIVIPETGANDARKEANTMYHSTGTFM